MYQQFFGLAEKPFDVTPDPRFLYLSEQHQEALAAIIYGIRERRGFITLIGEVGTGKTTLLNATMESMDENTKTAFIFNTDLRFEAMLHMVLMELDLASPDESVPKHAALERLNSYATKVYADGGNVVLIIDEAQNLDLQTMENLRLLSNLETRRHKLLQIVLSGQPELDEKLKQKALRQLVQRINLRRYLTPLDEADTYRYIAQHLTIAGYKGKTLFDKAALRAIWEYAGGVPRKINLLCDNALLIAYGLGKKKINAAIIEEAVSDLSWSPYDEYASPIYLTNPENRTANKKPALFQHRYLAVSLILVASLMLGAGSFGFFQVKSEEISKLSLKAKHYIKSFLGIYESDPADAEEKKKNQKQSKTEDHDPLPTQTGQTDPPAPPQKKQSTVSAKPLQSAVLTTKPPENEPKTETAVTESRPMETNATHPPEAEEKMPSAAAKKQQPPETALPDQPEQIEKQAPEAPKKTPAIKKGPDTPKTIVVQKNDYLMQIVKKIYGDQYKSAIKVVLKANPEIKDPNLIRPGQVIKLPAIQTADESKNEAVSKKQGQSKPGFFEKIFNALGDAGARKAFSPDL